MRTSSNIPFRHGECHFSIKTTGFHSIWHDLCELIISDRFSYLTLNHCLYMCKLLKDSLLKRKDNQVIACLIALARRCYSLPELFFMVALEMLKNMPSTHTLCVQLYKNAFLACSFLQQEILLNFALYLVEKQHDVSEGLELLKSKSSIVAFNQNLMHRAYMGLFEYLVSAPRQKGTNVEEHDEEFDDDFVDFAQHRKIQDFSANQSLDLFKDVFESPGIWDIFIPCNINLETTFKSLSAAKNFLQKYRDKNPLNPNSHRYLYHFLKENQGTEEEKQKALESLFHIDSTSELLIDYISCKLKSEDKSNIARLLFEKLDHVACKMDEETWLVFERFLSGNQSDFTVTEEVKMLWREREKWWPNYHFSTRNIDALDDSVVVMAKAKVAELLMGENTFSSKVFKAQNTNLPKDDPNPLLQQTTNNRKRKLPTAKVEEEVESKRERGF